MGDTVLMQRVRYTAPPKRVSECVAEAFLRPHCVEISYQSEAGERTLRVIEPQYILLNWPIWYILAWDHLRSSSRVFRVDRIQNARLVEGSFQMRAKELFNGCTRRFGRRFRRWMIGVRPNEEGESPFFVSGVVSR